MARETKVGLIVGLGVILFVSVFVSDYLGPGIGRSTRRCARLISLTRPPISLNSSSREDQTQPATPIADPRDLAAVSLESIEQRQDAAFVINPPPRSPVLTGPIDDTTPIASIRVHQTAPPSVASRSTIPIWHAATNSSLTAKARVPTRWLIWRMSKSPSRNSSMLSQHGSNTPLLQAKPSRQSHASTTTGMAICGGRSVMQTPAKSDQWRNCLRRRPDHSQAVQ